MQNTVYFTLEQFWSTDEHGNWSVSERVPKIAESDV